MITKYDIKFNGGDVGMFPVEDGKFVKYEDIVGMTAQEIVLGGSVKDMLKAANDAMVELSRELARSENDGVDDEAFKYYLPDDEAFKYYLPEIFHTIKKII